MPCAFLGQTILKMDFIFHRCLKWQEKINDGMHFGSEKCIFFKNNFFYLFSELVKIEREIITTLDPIIKEFQWENIYIFYSEKIDTKQ